MMKLLAKIPGVHAFPKAPYRAIKTDKGLEYLFRCRKCHKKVRSEKRLFGVFGCTGRK